MINTADENEAEDLSAYQTLLRLDNGKQLARTASRAALSLAGAYSLWELLRNPAFVREAELAIGTEEPAQLLQVLAQHRAAIELGSMRITVQHTPQQDHAAHRIDGKFFVRDGAHLYTGRHDRIESEIADHVVRLLEGFHPADDTVVRLADDALALHPLQLEAVTRASQHGLFVLSGGPGTGKTTVVGRILAHAIANGLAPTQIALAAPTGKAADRLSQAVAQTGIGLGAQTLHRLLRFVPRTRSFAHHQDAPLLARLVVVDEASMLDPFVMVGLLRAMPAGARLILVGDADQLPAVDGGEVLRDLLSVPQIPRAELTYNHRVSKSDGGALIANLAENIRARVPQSAHAALAKTPARETLDQFLSNWMNALSETNTPMEALHAMDRYRVLTALRDESSGELLTTAQGLSNYAARLAQMRMLRATPVMVDRNDHNLALFNGDTGAWIGNDVFFRRGDQLVRYAYTTIAPLLALAWAITIHKAQGSEYEHVLLVMPNKDIPQLLSRSIVYTGVTRARTTLQISCDEALLEAALLRENRRETGLAARLETRLRSQA